MVYIRLGESVYHKMKDHIDPQKLITCSNDRYISYPQFKRISHTYHLQMHKEIGRNDLITYHQMDQLIQSAKQTPQQRRLIEQLKSKRELRLLKQINPTRDQQDYYFQKKGQNKGFRQLTQTVSFSVAFIFTFFMAGLTGYYVGAFFLGWSLAQSLMLALAFIIVTLVVETSLFIIKQSRVQQKKGNKRSNSSSLGSFTQNLLGAVDKKKKQ